MRDGRPILAVTAHAPRLQSLRNRRAVEDERGDSPIPPHFR